MTTSNLVDPLEIIIKRNYTTKNRIFTNYEIVQLTMVRNIFCVYFFHNMVLFIKCHQSIKRRRHILIAPYDNIQTMAGNATERVMK